MQRPFVCHRPKLFDTPIIYNSPHSGRMYDSSFLGQSVLSFNEIRVSEDYYVDQLFQSATENGAFLLEACFPRSFVDVNRSASELDQKLIAELSPTIMSPRASAGLGVIPRIVGDGIESYSKNSVSFHEFIEDINTEYTKDQKIDLLRFMWDVAYADTKLDIEEERLIRRVADLIKIKDIEVLKLKDNAKK